GMAFFRLCLPLVFRGGFLCAWLFPAWFFRGVISERPAVAKNLCIGGNQKSHRHAVLNEARLQRLSDTRVVRERSKLELASFRPAKGGICWTRNQDRRRCRERGWLAD